MHGKVTTDAYFTGDLIGFTAGVVITVLLLALTLRAARLPGTPVANVMVALCALFWNLGGLVHVGAIALGLPKEAQPAITASAVQFTGAALWPIPMLAIWRDFALLPWQRVGSRILQIFAFLSAAAIVGSLWSAAILGVTLLPFGATKEFTSYNGSILMVLGIAVSLWGRLTSRVVWFSSVTALLGVLGATLSMVILNNFSFGEEFDAALVVIAEQSVLLILLGAFFLFARFRFADLFIRSSLRILLATLLAIALVLILDAPVVSRLANLTACPRAVSIFGATILVTFLLSSFALLDRSVGAFVNRWIFQVPDYRNAARRLGEELSSLHLESEIKAAVEKTARDTLELDDVRSIPIGRLPGHCWPAEIHEGEIVELDRADPLRSLLSMPEVEMLVPVRAGGKVIAALAISPGLARRGMVTHEVNYLRTVAAHFGGRLDSLRLERESVERQSREALMLHQLTEAELRALRAQINPHFLFNSLNSIANLIMANPGLAENMTLRLAKVFRYVLAHSAQHMTSIHEEIEFLRAYLQIEEARLGNRLRVEFDIAPEVALEHIPSLIMQPLVENALKHGLAPKPGPGRLWISAQAHGDQICLKVEDDGLGPGFGAPAEMNGGRLSSRGNGHRSPFIRAEGVGLANIAKRLTTLYQERAQIRLEARETGGTRVIVLVPRGGGLEMYEKSTD